MNIWMEEARASIKKHGYAEALRLAMKFRDENSPGTAGYLFYNALQKCIRRLGR